MLLNPRVQTGTSESKFKGNQTKDWVWGGEGSGRRRKEVKLFALTLLLNPGVQKGNSESNFKGNQTKDWVGGGEGKEFSTPLKRGVVDGSVDAKVCLAHLFV